MNDRAMTKAMPAGMTATETGDGGRALARSADVGETALAASAEAEVKARYIMARQSPRNDDNARIMLLRACARPGFADLAIYSRPQGGKKIEGLSIRFAEEARRQWGNIFTSADVIFEDDEKRIVSVASTDLEVNITERVTCVVPKTMERKHLKQGEVPLRSRINSGGELVYILPADEGAMRTQQKAEEAKARRQTILALIPADILDDCKVKIYETQRNRDAADPAAAKKKLLDSFAELGIMPDQIEERYLGHPLEQVSPEEVLELRAVYAALRDGERWAEICAAKLGETGDAKLDQAANEAKKKIAEKKAAIATKAGARKGDASPAAAPATAKTQHTAAPTLADEQKAAAIDAGREPGDDG